MMIPIEVSLSTISPIYRQSPIKFIGIQTYQKIRRFEIKYAIVILKILK